MTWSKTHTISLLCIALVATALVTYRFAFMPEESHPEYDRFLAKGIIFYEKESYQQALDTLAQIPDSVDQNWRIPYYKASSLVKMKKYEEAKPYLEQSRGLNPREAKIHFALGITYYKLGNLDLAKGYFTSTLEIDPSHEHAKGLMDIMSRLQNQSSKPENIPEIDSDI